jgi:hypothetical protein
MISFVKIGFHLYKMEANFTIDYNPFSFKNCAKSIQREE